jgi:uncharacterized membrane protein
LFEADALSYSLLGEDLIVNAIFQALGISIPVYAEIGVLEPIQNSNTYLFYERGGTGILVEADPRCEQKIRHFRGNDKYIAKAIGPQRCMLPIYRGSITTLSPTCSERWDYYKNQKSEPTEMVEVVTFDDIFLNENIQYVSLDIEELDEAVIKSIDFGKYPVLLVFCSETRLNQNVYLHMDHHDFARFAFTRDNEIYVRKSIIPVLLNNFDCKRIHDMCVFLNSKVLLA